MTRRHEQVRLHNLELLISEAGSAAELARKAGTSPSYLSQVRRQLTTQTGTPRSLGDELADKLERSMEKPRGWMDEPHNEAREAKQRTRRPDAKSKKTSLTLHPLISWVQAGHWQELDWNFTVEHADEVWPCPVDCSDETFVLRVKGQSMEPRFNEGDLIFVDPHAEPGHKKFVVVRSNESMEATFKQLIVEENRRYLKALNPDWPDRIVAIGENTTICGVVVFKGEEV
jgi:SOS-response transcriptional repressor LexA